MALEAGGRADKIGNQYENHFLGKQLLLLIQDKLQSLEVEPLGSEGVGVEFISVTKDGIRKYYQCKASNGAKGHWNIFDLARYDLFTNIKTKLATSNDSEFHFISPLSYGSISDLCDRARTNHSAHDYWEHQLSNKELRADFEKCEEAFGLSHTNDAELVKLVNILSRCYFDQVPILREAIQDIEIQIAFHFSGDESTIRILLENFVNDEGKYGIELSSYDIAQFLEHKGFHLKNYGKDDTTWKRIQEINHTYWRTYSPINGVFISRNEADTVIQYLDEGKSVVLHGKAGTGKSGCVEIISRYLETKQIPFLRLKLDEYIPQNNTVQYGQSLGLPDSPVRCLQSIAASKPCVLILDQLDALRWTATHSPTSLAVCKEMIHELKTANAYYGASMSIIFVTRTFDLKNDVRIRQLFEEQGENLKSWERVEVSPLADKDVANTVGKCYASLSQKLKHLLKNPASLFVWTRLDDPYRAKYITSANQLVDEWWKQILERCEKRGYASKEVNSLVQELAQKMSNISKFALPSSMYSGYGSLISLLASEGILVESSKKISFAHQTFLDYFVVCESLSQITSGKTVVELVGNPDKQTPNLRYRFFVLLQELLDFDGSIFLTQCQQILDSEYMRFYYQCAVFDALAQQSTPSRKLCTWAWKYMNDPKWREYVRQVVYLGSPGYVRSLPNAGFTQWLSDEGILLLRSINEKDPAFVVRTVTPMCFQSEEQDQKIMSCLCFDVNDDSEEMYQLRMKLLKKRPQLLGDRWATFYHLMETGSKRIIDYILLILENYQNECIANIHFPDSKDIERYVKNNYEDVVSSVVPKLLEITAGMVDNFSSNRFSKEYTQWECEEHNGSVLRKILFMATRALEEYAVNSPIHFIEIMFRGAYSNAFVGNELILSGITKLPVSYADNVLHWIIQDFPQHIFNYTGTPSDFLATTKYILQKFSPYCSKHIHLRLEQCIFYWKDPVAQMVRTLKDRIEVNNQKCYHPVYYAYWGFMQKELLPKLDQTRLSKTGAELLSVVNRNEWIHTPHYSCGYSFGAAKGVLSPISGYTDKINDKTWLQIIKTPNEKMRQHNWKETPSAYIEATHSGFAASLGRQAGIQPERFAKLSLRFPDGCALGYISAVLQALQHEDSTNELADISLTSDVIRKYSSINDSYIQSCIASIVQKRSEEQWPEDILAIIEKIALQSVAVSAQRYIATEKELEESAHSLYNEVYNSAQGNAILAIRKLLFAHSALHVRFRNAVSTLVFTDIPFIRIAITDCIVAYYNSDPEFASECFRNMLQADFRVLIANRSWDILIRDFDNAREFYRERLMSAAKSAINDLAEQSAGFICALAVYHKDDVLYHSLYNKSYTSKQAARICSQAVKCFEYEEHRERSKEIILYVVENYDIEANSISTNFFKKHILIARDKDFLLTLVNSATDSHIVYSLSKYLCNTDESIVAFADVIYQTVKKSATLYRNNDARLGLDELIRCVAHLYDEGKEDSKVQSICLDAWDELYKNNLHDIKSLSTILDDLN